jgi:hypothetical protein
MNLMIIFLIILFGVIQMRNKKEKIYQLSNILKKINIKDVDDGKLAIDFFVSFLLYLSPGDVIKTHEVDFIKVDNEFIQLNIKINKEDMVDNLEKYKIIKFV